MDTSNGRPSPAQAIVCTAVALAALNVGIAVLIVTMIGARSFAPTWIALVCLAGGALAAALAVQQWRRYLAARRDF